MADRGFVTFTIDGREVSAPEGEWLLDAAKRGDVEIPYFCYERKLGQPVGACRMCMVEIEGLPKLQVSCATPVKDGMVVYTQTDRVKQAQNAIVEFLLVNHPLDCPVCDKGGECPLQDISYGWGPGRSRFVEEKRNFPKPIALSPLVAIDRERCILCYRCVRFSQEVAEDNQLAFLERGDHTFVGTFDGRPYVAPFAGNVIELCPVGALTSTPYRFRARPWDVVNAGSICTLCPSHCNVEFTVRDERVERVLARENPDVDDGWLCDKGRFAYQAIHSAERVTQPLVRDGGLLRPATWERALDAAADGLRKAGASAAAIAGDGSTNEEAYLLQRIFREGLGSANLDSRAGESLDPALVRLLTRPELSARVADLDRAAVVLVIGADPINEAPILDLRIRKAVRRLGARLVVAAPQPTALDGGASELLSFAPGAEEAFLRALQKAMLEQSGTGGVLDGRESPGRPHSEGSVLAGQQDLVAFLAARSLDELAERAGADARDLRDAAALLVDAESIVIVWGERIVSGERGSQALAALADLALLAGIDGGETSGLIEIPAVDNGRGLREVGFVPNLGPGLTDVEPGLGARRAAVASGRGELGAFYLLHADPLREQPDRPLWERALAAAGTVVAHSQFLTEALARHADVVFPAESHAEKEGTVTHPDGRIQRLRPAIGHPRDVRPEWQLLLELGCRLGVQLEHLTAGMILAEIGDRVPLYRGITLDEIGGRGVRWQEREPSHETARTGLGELRFSSPAPPPELPSPPAGALRLVEVPDLWASWETDHAPALSFLRARQELLLHPDDGARLAVADGQAVEVASNGHAVQATARLRASARPGCAYVVLGTAEENSNLLTNGRPPFVEIRPSAGLPAAGSGPAKDAVQVALPLPLQLPLADTQFVESTGVWIVKSLVIFLVIFSVVPVLTLVERKLIGRFQNRYGPNRAGPYGLLQPLADVLKLISKEQSHPRTAAPLLMALAPAIIILTAVASLAIIPFGDVKHGLGAKYGLYGIDVNIGVLYAFAFGSLAFYGVMLGGWASGSKYSFLGAMRSAAQLISYEVSLALALIGVVMMAGSLSLVDIVHAQGKLWYAIPQLVGLAIFMATGLAELNRAPFDLPEADAELVAGYNTEYGGMRFGSYLLAEYLNMVVIAGLVSALFLGGWMGPGPGFLDPFWMGLKMFAVIFLFIWVRATLPRLRYDQLMSFGWKVLLPLATLNLMVTAVLVVVTT